MYIYVREEGRKGLFFLGMEGGDSFLRSSTHWRIERNSEDFLGESTKERERSKCNRVHPGMLLITLGILTHFFRVFVSEYSYIVDWCGRKGPQIVVLRSVPDIYYTLIRILFSLILLPIPKHRLYQYECHDD